MKNNKWYALFAICLIASSAMVQSCSSVKDGEYELHLFTTNDVHGTYFDSTYVSSRTKNSLMAVSHYVDSVRTAIGSENVIFVDGGDCLQGDNAAYYFNYVDTVSKHVYARMVEYMKYDAIAVGNHDIETGHPVYDRMVSTMKVPFLAANAVRNDNGEPYFQDYVTIKRHGIKIAIVGFTNPNIKAWLSEKLWSGMQFVSLLPYAQEYVDKVIAKEKPQVVILVAHSGTGPGDGSVLESQGMDMYKSLKGVDFIVCAHDHRPFVAQSDSLCFINSGSHCRNIGHGVLKLTVENGEIVSKSLSADLIPVNKDLVDARMEELFHPDYEAVKAFTLQPVGDLKVALRTRDAYKGMSDYLNLVHAVSLSAPEAQISFAAPLTYNGDVNSGTLLYNDLFTIYPYENELYVVKLTGKEIRDYLEFSYNNWIQTVPAGGKGHVLNIVQRDDPRNRQEHYSFASIYFNFDSAAGLNYTVDVTKPQGSRIVITTLADGTPFSDDAQYNVAMTSYRASGGGNLLRDGAGVDPDTLDERIVARYPAIRDMLYDYIKGVWNLDPAEFGNPAKIGSWRFVPERVANPLLEKDMALMFN